MHVRQQIREAAVAALNGATAAGASVFSGRTFPLSDENLPGLCVYALNEATEVETTGSASLLRELTIAVEGYARANSDLDDALDGLAEEIEVALGAAGRVGGAIDFVGPTSTEIEFADPGAEVPAAVIRLEFRYLYQTALGAPSIAA